MDRRLEPLQNTVFAIPRIISCVQNRSGTSVQPNSTRFGGFNPILGPIIGFKRFKLALRILKRILFQTLSIKKNFQNSFSVQYILLHTTQTTNWRELVLYTHYSEVALKRHPIKPFRNFWPATDSRLSLDNWT